ncbi:MAG: sulfite exporter TauE/SafE family protein, partial [Thermodesulfobacteriota bacterium]
TKVVPGITIRGFYAMAVVAGFVNRIFALPGKLRSLEVLKLSSATTKVLDAIGVWAFFLVIAIFGVWVIGTFVKNTRVLRGMEG